MYNQYADNMEISCARKDYTSYEVYHTIKVVYETKYNQEHDTITRYDYHKNTDIAVKRHPIPCIIRILTLSILL